MSSFGAGDKMVAEEPMNKIISNIETFSVSEKKYSAQICQELDEIKETVRINNNRFDNKKDESKAAMENFRANHDDVVAVFRHLISMYKASKSNAAKTVKKKRGEV